jgi:Protein of unknown function (DUF2514)
VIERALIAGLVWMVTLFGSGWWAYSEGKKSGTADVRAQWDAANAISTEKAMRAQAAARTEEMRRTAELEGIANEAVKKAQESAAAASAAVGAGQRLRQRAEALAARCGGSGGHSALAGSGKAASAPGDLLYDVLGRLDEAAGQLAAAADQRGIAGQACVSAYEALKP